MSQKRKCKNWLTTFDEWAMPRSEAPASMIHWAGLFALSALMKRKVSFPRTMMGSYEIYPNLYVIFVGDPGVVRKSTTAGYAEDLLVSISDMLDKESITFASTATSDSALIKALTDSPDSSLAIVSSEFSSLIKTTPEGMYELLTDLFDGKRKFEYGTRSYKIELAENPVINLLAATTPAWISGQPQQYFQGGGFASRVIFIYEKEKRQRKLYYDHLDWKHIRKLEEDLLHDLKIIACAEGEFSHDCKATKDTMEGYYLAMPPAESENMKGYNERKMLHLHKLSMLVSLAESNDCKITLEHFNEAVRLLTSIESKMPRALSSAGANPHSSLLDAITDYVLDHPEGVSQKQLATRFMRDLGKKGRILDDLTEVMEALQIIGKVTMVPNGKSPMYLPGRKT